MSDRLLVSTRKGLFVVARSAAGWAVSRSVFLGENVTLSLPDPHNNGWFAALNLGHFGVKLKFTPDGGATWEDRAVPAYSEGDTFATGDGKPPQPATLKLIWALTADRGRLWAGTAPGGLFKSDDGAKTWELVRGLWDRPERSNWFGGGYDYPAIDAVHVDPRSRDTVRVSISCGGVWRTDDGGATWRVTAEGLFAEFMPPERQRDPTIQDVHMMAQCPGAPDHLWIQHHNGCFRSTDAGETWTAIERAPSVFGFAVAVHPSDPRMAWFVPAVKDECRVPVDGKLVVSRTRDGGTTFDVLRTGLPQEQCYDIVLRHALAVDGTGQRVAFGSTTGGLWISEDQGDRWQPVPARLPPVHAVCFA